MVREKELVSVRQFLFPQELWKFVESEIFQEVFACGTGKDDFLHHASEQQTFEASSQKGENNRAIAANIGFIAKLLAIERVSLHILKKNWGGGFEIPVLLREKNKKLLQEILEEHFKGLKLVTHSKKLGEAIKYYERTFWLN